MSEVKEKKAKPIFCEVTSAAMGKSRVGTVNRSVQHPEYKRYIKRKTKIMFHDEKNETNVGDKVLISACRPMSKRKRFNLFKIVEKATQEI
ncbi:MAG: 30S ribosomal protein S17 [Oligoflexales bacterium]